MFCFSQFQALLYLQLRILQIIKHKESRGVCPSLFVKCLRVQYLIVEMMLLFRQSVNYFSCKEGYSVLQKILCWSLKLKIFWMKWNITFLQMLQKKGLEFKVNKYFSINQMKKIKYYFTVQSTVSNNCFQKFCLDESIKNKRIGKEKDINKQRHK